MQLPNLEKQREAKQRPTKLTKTKSQRSKGVTNPKLPSQASKGVLLKWFCEDICGLPLWGDMDQVYVSSLMVVSQEMESDVYVLGSGV